MSSIAKIAVYDARLMQDAPAYAVQKGALSVSVAPFNAISANASSMVFQVLVPSLNVFVDRQIQLRTTLNFTANLFYSGPRSQTAFEYNGYTNSTFTTVGTTLTLGSAPAFTINARDRVYFAGLAAAGENPVFPNTFEAVVVGVYGLTLVCDRLLPFIPAGLTNPILIFASPLSFDAPDPATGVRFDLSSDQLTTGVNQTEAFLPLGYATACSSKDLSYCLFPVQSSLSNMTATLNDCTVSTNGDTLHEQLLLTGTKENVKQRTTPSKYDTYAWGHDDANNGSGNFSSYSVVDTTGDLPNGAFPTIWYADASGSLPLANIVTIQAANPAGAKTTGASSSYPFLGAPARGSFNSNYPDLADTYAGAGWYIAQPNGTNVTGQSTSAVVVPFVDSQPVWTTAFPGGDLLCLTTVSPQVPPGFDIASINGLEQLILLKAVPPYSMIGARIYVLSTAAPGVPVTAVGFVAALTGGTMGAIGSTYTFVTGANGGLASIKTGLALQGGFQATLGPMPVFGSVATVEPLVISPLIFADSAQFQSVGLYGMTNMQFVLNFTSKLGTAQAIDNNVDSSDWRTTSVPYWTDDLTQQSSNTGNILRSSGLRTTLSNLAFANVSNSINGPWINPALYVTFLTPGPDVTLPLVSTVPYAEFPRYILNQTVTPGQIGNTTLATNTISLTSIPDMIMLYVKPSTKGPSQLDTYMPIRNVSISFDNFSNLCSGFQPFNLYECSVAAGLDMDWSQFRGYAAGAANSYSRVTRQSTTGETVLYKSQPVTQLSGAPLVLRMGHDITLSPGLAPGCLGNYSIQANILIDNTYGFFDYVESCTITLIAINTGFFETVRGQSAIRKTVLNSADVEAAIPEAGMSRTQLTRMIGHGMRSLGHSAGAATYGRSLMDKLRGPAGGGGSYGGEGGKRMREGGMSSGLR
jgi:hypothetical protein